MLWPPQNFLLYKTTTLIECSIQSFIRLNAIKADILKEFKNKIYYFLEYKSRLLKEFFKKME